MTVLEDGIDGLVGGEAGPEGGGEFSVVPPNGRQCKRFLEDGEQCANILPDGSPPARKYCDVHYVGKSGGAKKKERAPKLVLELGKGSRASSKDAKAEQTAQGAAAFMNVVATGFAIAGDNVCAGAVAQGAPAWAASIGELSKYQPILATIFAPAGGDNQVGAILGVLLATGAIALPVLAHHNLLPESIGAKMGGVFVAAEQTVAGDGSVVTNDTVPGAV